MKLKKIIHFKLLLSIAFAPIILAHPGHEEHYDGPKEVALSEKDIQFVLEHQNVQLAYIPEIITELFILLKDVAAPTEFSNDLKEFMQYIDQGTHIISRSTAMKGIFGALALLKKYESTLPQSYLDQMCDVLYGYQKSLHKEEQVLQGLDNIKHV